MSIQSSIEWTDATWNPVTGCTEVSPGCDHCYARTFAERWRGIPGHPYEQGFDLRLWPERLEMPLQWMGVSVETLNYAWRVDQLRKVPAAIRFLSAEPLLGSLNELSLDDIHWVIAGGESGPGHRYCNPQWVRELREKCQEANIAFFFKQWGGRSPKSGGRLLDGRTWDEYPFVPSPQDRFPLLEGLTENCA